MYLNDKLIYYELANFTKSTDFSNKNRVFPIIFCKGNIDRMLAPTPFFNLICKMILTIIYVRMIWRIIAFILLTTEYEEN